MYFVQCLQVNRLLDSTGTPVGAASAGFALAMAWRYK